MVYTLGDIVDHHRQLIGVETVFALEDRVLVNGLLLRALPDIGKLFALGTFGYLLVWAM